VLLRNRVISLISFASAAATIVLVEYDKK
jgi:hypothetical protein